MSMPLSDYRLEKLLLGELPDEESRALLADPEIAGRIALLEADNRRFLERHPFRPERFAPKPKGRAFSLRFRPGLRGFPSIRGILVPALSVCAVLALGLFVLPRDRILPDQDFRIKGGSSKIHLYKKTASEASELSNGSVVRPGDAVQVAYSSASSLYGFICSVDGNGNVTPHLPERGGEAAALQKGELKLLDFSYVLDDAPKYEIFLFVTSPGRFDVRPIGTLVSELRSERDVAAQLEKRLGGDFRVAAVKLMKE